MKRNAFMQNALEDMALKRVKRAFANRGKAPPEEAILSWIRSINLNTVMASTLKEIRAVAGAF